MKTEVEYTVSSGIPGDPPTKFFIDWNISFDVEGRGPEAVLKVEGYALKVRVEVGGEPFIEAEAGNLTSRSLKEWIAARAADLSPEAIGMTREECLRDYYEAEKEREYMNSQIGRPI
jgi:hypothetical protein